MSTSTISLTVPAVQPAAIKPPVVQPAMVTPPAVTPAPVVLTIVAQEGINVAQSGNTLTLTYVPVVPVPAPAPAPVPAPSGNVVIAPTGGVDNTNLITKIKSAIAQGLTAEITAGTYTLQPFRFDSSLSGAKVLVDAGVIFTDAPTGYSLSDRMFTFSGSNISFVGAGSAVCTITMPNTWARNKANPSEWNHAISFDGSSNVKVSGFTTVKAGGDGVNFNAGSGISVDDVYCNQSIRQGWSVTGGCTNVSIGTIGAASNNNSGFDFEPNAPCNITGWTIGNLTTRLNPGGGLSFGFFNLDGTSKLDITVQNFDSESDDQIGLAFWNKNSGTGVNATGTVTVQKYTINSSGWDGTYGRKSNDGWTMSLNNGTINNSNRNLTDRYGSNSALGVAVSGGETGTPGGVHWNGVTITGGHNAMTVDGAKNTTVSGTYNGSPISYSA